MADWAREQNHTEINKQAHVFNSSIHESDRSLNLIRPGRPQWGNLSQKKEKKKRQRRHKTIKWEENDEKQKANSFAYKK